MIGTNDLDKSSVYESARHPRHFARPRRTATASSTAHATGRLFGLTPDRRSRNACQWRHNRLCRFIPEQAKAWARAGLAAGGKTIEDPPGVREGAAGKVYLAYLRDPDGNKICALHRVK